MTSGTFTVIPVNSITIDRANRQRRELEDIEDLADSISRRGLIHPIVVTRNHILVAGERRLTAIRSLGWDSIAVQYTDELDPTALRAIELEENVKRKDIPWQDQCAAVQEFHQLMLSEEPSWDMERTAGALGFSYSSIFKYLQVAKEITSGNELVTQAPKFSTAIGIVTRAEERRQNSEAEAIAGLMKAPKPPDIIIQADFIEWQKTYKGKKFNFLHCDFPYGISADGFDQGGAKAHGGYSDTFENYTTLLDALDAAMANVISESAHLMFWFSMKHYNFTLERLRSMGWAVDPFPLMWYRSDNAGILPDPNRGPRRVYEVCFFGHRGDRKIVRAVGNATPAATVRERHMSEKPQQMLEHFFRMIVDDSTSILDPTAGSGSALRAARTLGASRLQGLEINPEYVERANGAFTNG